MKNHKSPDLRFQTIDDDLELIDKYLRKGGIPIQTQFHEGVQSLRFYNDRCYISLFVTLLNCIKYSIIVISENKTLDIALSNPFSYYLKENFFVCMLMAMLKCGVSLQKLLMIYYQKVSEG